MENIVKFEFNNNEIVFEMNRDNVMVNATQMAKVFGKHLPHFLENDSTKKFIAACLNSRNSDYINVKSEEDLIVSKQKSGTWMHRVLALKFAAWLDSDFELWVFSTIDYLLFNYYKKLEESLKCSAKRKNEIDEIKEELRADEKFLKLELLELEERQAAYWRGKQNKGQLELFRDGTAH